MSFRTQAETAAQAVQAALGSDLGPEETKTITNIIEQAIIDSARQVHESCAKVVVDCCPEDRDIAHKITRQINQQRDALIVNLSSLR